MPCRCGARECDSIPYDERELFNFGIVDVSARADEARVYDGQTGRSFWIKGDAVDFAWAFDFGIATAMYHGDEWALTGPICAAVPEARQDLIWVGRNGMLRAQCNYPAQARLPLPLRFDGTDPDPYAQFVDSGSVFRLGIDGCHESQFPGHLRDWYVVFRGSYLGYYIPMNEPAPIVVANAWQLGIKDTTWHIDEWAIKFHDSPLRWIGADGELRESYYAPTYPRRPAMAQPMSFEVEAPTTTRGNFIAVDIDDDDADGDDDGASTSASCADCNTRMDSEEICGECDRGRQCCCNCFTCAGCDNTWRRRSSANPCDDCNRCGSCCGCEDNDDESREHPQFIDRKPTFHDAARLEFKRNPSKRYLAAEIEVGGMDAKGFAGIESVCETWGASIEHDGSLPEDTGFEIPTAPANGDKFCTEIEEICGQLKQGKAFLENCGLHVHIDARDFSHYDMRRLVMLYAKLEEALFQTQDEERRREGFCDPCGQQYLDCVTKVKAPKASKHALMEKLYGGEYTTYHPKTNQPQMTAGIIQTDLRMTRRSKYSGPRYRALNLHSWVYRGTIECRLHRGSLDAAEIIPWGIFLACMVDYAMKTPESVIAALEFSSTMKAQRFMLDRIAPTREVRKALQKLWKENGDDDAIRRVSVRRGN